MNADPGPNIQRYPSLEWIVPGQMALCAICVESRVCFVCDREFGRGICDGCLWAVKVADVELARTEGYRRPEERRLS